MANKPKCIICNTREAKSRIQLVCDDCFATKCPECGHTAFWLTTSKYPAGRYACFGLDCNWASSRAPTEEEKFLSYVHSWRFCRKCGIRIDTKNFLCPQGCEQGTPEKQHGIRNT